MTQRLVGMAMWKGQLRAIDVTMNRSDERAERAEREVLMQRDRWKERGR